MDDWETDKLNHPDHEDHSGRFESTDVVLPKAAPTPVTRKDWQLALHHATMLELLLERIDRSNKTTLDVHKTQDYDIATRVIQCRSDVSGIRANLQQCLHEMPIPT